MAGKLSQPAASPPADESTGQLVSRLSQDLSELVRDELQLAQTELADKARNAAVGAGLFGAAGALAGYGAGVLIAAAILALALAVPAWLAAVVIGVVLMAAAAAAALLARMRLNKVTPPIPERAVDNVKRDVDAVRNHRDH